MNASELRIQFGTQDLIEFHAMPKSAFIRANQPGQLPSTAPIASLKQRSVILIFSLFLTPRTIHFIILVVTDQIKQGFL
jgi:hypothetical protein